MKGECYYMKFCPTLPQCTNTEVDYHTLKLGNPTDKWTWCKEHRDSLGISVEPLTPEVSCDG